jgi:hypothetical protein
MFEKLRLFFLKDYGEEQENDRQDPQGCDEKTENERTYCQQNEDEG